MKRITQFQNRLAIGVFLLVCVDIKGALPDRIFGMNVKMNECICHGIVIPKTRFVGKGKNYKKVLCPMMNIDYVIVIP